jgi:hypothetical protein
MSAADFLWLRREVETLRLQVAELQDAVFNAKPAAVAADAPRLVSPPVEKSVDKRTKAWRQQVEDEV